MPRTRASCRAGLAGAAAVAVVLLAASPAAAHVTITVSTTRAGATAEVRLEVPHGCAGSATTALSVRVPDGVTEVAAAPTDRWAADVSSGAVTFLPDEPVPDGLREEVAFSVRLPDEVGAVLVFPVVQRCEEGESAWTEVAEDAASRDALELPAPVVVVSGAGGPGGPGGGSGAASAPAAAGDDRRAAWTAAGVLALGCVASGAVLAARRRRA